MDLTNEVSQVRKEVSHEYKWMQALGSRSGLDRRRVHADVCGPSEISVMLAKRRRLMFLFVKDLSRGVSGEMLLTKYEKDASVASSKKRPKLEGVSSRSKVHGWMFVGVLNLGMLFYVFLFAMRQTQSRQSAWFQSFVMWLLFEMVVSSTSLVVLTHLLIPLYVLADVSKLKEKVLGDLMAFREKYLERESAAPRDLEEGAGVGCRFGAAVCVAVTKGVGEKKTEGQASFNAAKYLFVSWRVAWLCRELPESRLILEFNTPWPKKRFGLKKAEVAGEYEQDVVASASSQIAIFFLASLFRCHVLVQDMIVQTLCNSGLGLLAVGMIGLFAIDPVLPVAVVLGLLALVGCLLRIASVKHSRLRERLASVTATKPKARKSDPCSQPPLSQEECSQPPTASPAVNETAQDNTLVVAVDQHRDDHEEDNDDSDEEKGDKSDSDEDEGKDEEDKEGERFWIDSDEDEGKDEEDKEGERFWIDSHRFE
jgi:hypothetical protein